MNGQPTIVVQEQERQIPLYKERVYTLAELDEIFGVDDKENIVSQLVKLVRQQAETIRELREEKYKLGNFGIKEDHSRISIDPSVESRI